MARGDDVQAVATVEAGALAKAMKHAAGVVERRNTIPILANVRLVADGETLEVTSTDLDVEFRQRVPLDEPAPLATTVDAARFAQLAQAVDGKAKLTLALEDNGRLTVKSGRSRWQLPALPVADFPTIPAEDLCGPVTVSGVAFAAEVGRVVWCFSTEEVRYWLRGTFLDNHEGHLRLVGCEGNVLALVDTEHAWPEGAVQAIVPTKLGRLIERVLGEHEGDAELAWSATKVRVQAGEITLTGKTIDGTYPDYRRVIPPPCGPLRVEPDSFRSGMRRVALVANEKTRFVKLTRDADKLTLSVVSPEGGTASEEIPAQCEGGFESGFNHQYLDAMLAAIGGDSVEIHQADPGAPALFRRTVSDGAIGVVMPMRV